MEPQKDTPTPNILAVVDSHENLHFFEFSDKMYTLLGVDPVMNALDFALINHTLGGEFG